MNILVDSIPTSVEIDGIEYEVNTDFRILILFELLIMDKEVGESDKLSAALELFYKKRPINKEIAIEKLLWFYRCGKDIIESKSKNKGKNISQIYSYDYDDDYIYAAFMDQYKIDLQDIDYLHWWKFKAMFKSLKEDNMIVKIMGYRSMDLSKIKDKEQKTFYKSMKELYKIPINISKDEEEKKNEIESALLNGGDLSNIL